MDLPESELQKRVRLLEGAVLGLSAAIGQLALIPLGVHGDAAEAAAKALRYAREASEQVSGEHAPR